MELYVKIDYGCFLGSFASLLDCDSKCLVRYRKDRRLHQSHSEVRWIRHVRDTHNSQQNLFPRPPSTLNAAINESRMEGTFVFGVVSSLLKGISHRIVRFNVLKSGHFFCLCLLILEQQFHGTRPVIYKSCLLCQVSQRPSNKLSIIHMTRNSSSQKETNTRTAVSNISIGLNGSPSPATISEAFHKRGRNFKV